MTTRRYNRVTTASVAVAYAAGVVLRQKPTAATVEANVRAAWESVKTCWRNAVNAVRHAINLRRARLAQRCYNLGNRIAPTAQPAPEALPCPTTPDGCTCRFDTLRETVAALPEQALAYKNVDTAPTYATPHSRTYRRGTNKGKVKGRIDYKPVRSPQVGWRYWYKVDGKWRELLAPASRAA